MLRFAGGLEVVDPKVGLALYGPFDADHPTQRTVIRLGVVGTGRMVDLTRQWLDRCREVVEPIRHVRRNGRTAKQQMDPTAFTAFPGVREAFHCEFVLDDACVEVLTEEEVATLDGIKFFEPRVSRLVQLTMRRLEVLADKASPPDVVIIALPSSVRRICTIPSRHRRRPCRVRTVAEALRESLARDESAGQSNLIDVAAAHDVDLNAKNGDAEHVEFHGALKACAMGTGFATQLVWQSTLTGKGVEDDATRAWNFWTGIYYKAGGVPWRATGLESGTCYVGLAFYRDRSNGSLRTCMAQAFSDQAEGIVLRSEPFRWVGSRSPHLPRHLARDLMGKVLDTYQAHVKQIPGRVVVNKWQRFNKEERNGFREALKGRVHSADFVAFGSRGIRFFRTGKEPPLRGTMIRLGEGNALLYTLGYVPFLERYDGMRIPRPIEIVEHYGSAPLTKLCCEILALTKLDWNSTAFSVKEPITTAFSKNVGRILRELPAGRSPRSQHRFYM